MLGHCKDLQHITIKGDDRAAAYQTFSKILKQKEKMSISELIKSGSNVTLAVAPNDLEEFAKDIVERTKREIERELEETNSEVYYTADQTADKFSVDRTTLWRWAKRGYLVPIKVGGLVRYRRSDVVKILNHGQAK